MNPREQTRAAWLLFNKFSDDELNKLLELAGINPLQARSLKLHQVLVVWFHGNVPSLLEVAECARATELKII